MKVVLKELVNGMSPKGKVVVSVVGIFGGCWIANRGISAFNNFIGRTECFETPIMSYRARPEYLPYDNRCPYNAYHEVEIKRLRLKESRTQDEIGDLAE